MSPAGPLPEQPKRRLWLWIIGALVTCVVLFLLMNMMLMGVAEQTGAP
jgi:hypothetical protein